MTKRVVLERRIDTRFGYPTTVRVQRIAWADKLRRLRRGLRRGLPALLERYEIVMVGDADSYGRQQNAWVSAHRRYASARKDAANVVVLFTRAKP